MPHTTRPPRRIIKWHFIEFSERPPPLGGLSIYNLRGQTKKARLRRKYLADFVALHESLPDVVDGARSQQRGTLG